MLVKYITRSLYDNCEDSVEEYVTAEVDTVHGETIVTEGDYSPVDVVDNQYGEHNARFEKIQKTFIRYVWLFGVLNLKN